MAVRPRSRCSDRSSTAWIAYSPFAEMRTRSAHSLACTVRFATLGHGSAHTATLEDPRGVAGEVRDHDVGAGAADRGERFHHRPLLVEPAQTAGGTDHRVFARDRVGRERYAELRAGA